MEKFLGCRQQLWGAVEFQLSPSPFKGGVRSGIQGTDNQCLELVQRVPVPPRAVTTVTIPRQEQGVREFSFAGAGRGL